MRLWTAYTKMIWVGIALLAIGSAALGSPPVIDVVYPRARETDGKIVIAAVDSNFVFGSVTPARASLTINGFPIQLHENGAFLAFLPVPKKNQTYRLRAELNGEMSDTLVTFLLPKQLPPDTTTVPKIACPTVIRFLPGYNVTRTGIDGAYDLFPLEGTRCIALAQKKDLLKIRLTSSRATWVEPRFVEVLPESINQNSNSIYKIECQPEQNATKIVIPDIGRPLFRLEDFLEPLEVRLTLYGVISHIDLVQMQHDDPILDRITWEQIEDSVTTIHFHLKHQSWGYSASWNDNGLEITLKHPPDLEEGLKNLTIAIDPGHGGEQYGAISPTRQSEKDLNLTVASLLHERLIEAGANAVMIRNEDIALGLYDRIQLAREAGADLLISIHHNAHADGINPFLETNGIGTYYYRPQSIDFARTVHQYLVKDSKLPDDGLLYDNLALVRPTDFPAILIEIGYLTMPDQELILRDPSFQKHCVNAIYDGIKSFVKARRKGM
jgi:N-acetylmuramoyl-L-alanine amidase